MKTGDIVSPHATAMWRKEGSYPLNEKKGSWGKYDSLYRYYTIETGVDARGKKIKERVPFCIGLLDPCDNEEMRVFSELVSLSKVIAIEEGLVTVKALESKRVSVFNEEGVSFVCEEDELEAYLRLITPSLDLEAK